MKKEQAKCYAPQKLDKLLEVHIFFAIDKGFIVCYNKIE